MYSTRNIFITFFLHSGKIFFYFMNFSFDTFLVRISGLPFAVTKVIILLSACKLNSSSTRENTLRRILEYCVMKVK